MLKKGIPLHPTFIMEQIGKYRKRECGRTLMHFAMRRQVKRRKFDNAKEIELLLQLGYPMYEACSEGYSILVAVVSPRTDLAISAPLLKILIGDYKFDILQKTTCPAVKG